MDARKKGLIGAALGAFLLLASAFTNSWMTVRVSAGADINVGLRKAEACMDGVCQTESFSAVFGDKLSGFRTAALITFVLTLLASAFLILSVAIGIKGNARLGWFTPSSAALLFTALAMVLAFFTLLKFFGDTKGALGLGYSFYVFAMGVFASVAGSVFLGKAASSEGSSDGYWE